MIHPYRFTRFTVATPLNEAQPVANVARPSPGGLKKFVETHINLQAPKGTIREFQEKRAISRDELVGNAAQKQYDRYKKAFPKTFKAPFASKFEVDGKTVFMVGGYNRAYERFDFVIYDAAGQAMAKGNGTDRELAKFTAQSS